jgi:predicted SAM-dependent methyltransferase
MIALDIGCGLIPKQPFDIWSHLDLNPGPHIEYVCDFGSIPLPDASVEQIWLGDVIEHVPQWRHAEVLAEWHRILIPNGRISGQTPNLHKTVSDYVAGKISLQDALVPRLMGWADRPTELHYATYTPETLTVFFKQYGFDVRDYIASPGPRELPWWLIFAGRKS